MYTSHVSHFIHMNVYGGALQNFPADLKVESQTLNFWSPWIILHICHARFACCSQFDMIRHHTDDYPSGTHRKPYNNKVILRTRSQVRSIKLPSSQHISFKIHSTVTFPHSSRVPTM